MPMLKPAGKLVRVTFKVKRPKSKAGMEKLLRAMEKVAKKHGGKIKKKPK